MSWKNQEISDDQAAPASRKPRADGIESRRAILDAAARLATTHGLEGLSIGELARHIGMSKSGLYAHFKSKEELELATIETAVEIFDQDVLRKIPTEARGLARITALSEAFFAHLRRRIYPGGCFFATVAAKLAPNPSRVRDRLLQLQGDWVAQFVSALHQACEDGELPPNTDVDQLAFEIIAMMFRANFAWIVTDEERILNQARLGIQHAVSRVADQPLPNR